MSKLDDARKLFGTTSKHGARVSSATVDGDLMRALLELHQVCEEEAVTPKAMGSFGPVDGIDRINLKARRADLLHRIGVADAPRLVDRIAGLGEDLTRLRKAAQERDQLRKRLEDAQSESENTWDDIANALGIPGELNSTKLENEARRLRALVSPSDDRDPPTEQRRERIRLRDDLTEARRRIAELEEARDGYQNANTDLTAERDSLRDEVGQLKSAAWATMCDSLRALLKTAEAERDSLRQQLEAAERANASLIPGAYFSAARIAQSEQTELTAIVEQASARFVSRPIERASIEARKELESSDIATAAQQRIVALEGEVTRLEGFQREYLPAALLLNSRRVPLQIDGKQIAMVDRIAWLLSSHGQRIGELETAVKSVALDHGETATALGAACRERDNLAATLRAIAPVYADYQRLVGVAMRAPSTSLGVAVDYDLIDTARAALTPEQLELIERACKEGQ